MHLCNTRKPAVCWPGHRAVSPGDGSVQEVTEIRIAMQELSQWVLHGKAGLAAGEPQ